mgnify:CR=1 FL=1
MQVSPQRPVAPIRPGDTPFMTQAFSAHLRDAMRLNLGRRLTYARRTRGRSRPLSWLLVGLEWLCLPAARWFELRAVGVPPRQHLLELSFVSMQGLPSAEALPFRQAGPAPGQARLAQALMRRLRAQVRASLPSGDMVSVVGGCKRALAGLELLERHHDAHLAMSRHLVESLGRVAMVAERLGLGEDRLARDLVRLHAAGLGSATWLDTRAQRLHQQGAGVLVNDLPAIPFG